MKVGVLSDIHGNYYALKQVLISASKNGVEKLLILGDIVGYYYSPEKVLELLGDWDYEFIRGNHEVFLGKVRKGGVDIDYLQKKYGSGHKIALENLTEDQLGFLLNAPDKKQIEIDNIKVLMCHGTNWDADFYLYPDTNEEILRKSNVSGVDFVVVGHSHYSFVYQNTDSVLINVGSVGQSRSEGGQANWVIINTSNSTFELKATPYDVGPLIKEVEKNDPGTPYLQNILRRNNK
jgi:putative phosphoesterase